jgi:hypothetical protein
MKGDKCPVCGGIIPDNKRKYCRKECMEQANRERSLIQRNRNKIAREKKRWKKKDLVTIAVEARKAGMPYGQYVAQMENGGIEDE